MKMEMTSVNNVSPQAQDPVQPQAGKAKKKGATPEFDANLMAMLSGQEGQKAAPLSPVEAATQVELAGKMQSQADAQTTAARMASEGLGVAQTTALQKGMQAAASAQKADSGSVRIPDVKSLIQTENARQANGTIAEAFVAGPNQPWNPSWVFGAQKAEAARSAQGEQSPLSGILQEMQNAVAQAQGGDAKQISQAAQRVNQDLDSALQGLNGEIVGQSMESGGQETQVSGQPMNRVGGEAFLSLLQGAQEGATQGGMNSGQQQGGSFGENAPNPKSLKQQVLSGKTPGIAMGGLHAIEGGKGKGPGVKEEQKLSPELQGGVTTIAWPQANEKLQPQTPVLTGHVVPGSMMRERLTSETIQNITNQLSGISARGGNGEMRIRMNPGHLGELTIKVSTEGGQVGLKVQAMDPRAKKILEESLSSLRDGLAQQNLSLQRVDISVGQPSQSAASQFSDSNSWQQQSQANAGGMGFEGRGGQSQGSERNGDESNPVNLRNVRARAALSGMSSTSTAARDASGRLNVIA